MKMALSKTDEGAAVMVGQRKFICVHQFKCTPLAINYELSVADNVTWKETGVITKSLPLNVGSL
jgi:hypothetical protein